MPLLRILAHRTQKKVEKKKVYTKEFYEPVFQTSLMLVMGGDVEKIPALIKRRWKVAGTEKWINSHGHFEAVTIGASDGGIVMYFINTNPDIHTVAHEVMHLVLQHFERLGAKAKCNSSDEFYAYYQGYWTQKIVNFIRKIK